MEKWPKNPLDVIIEELKKPKYKDLAIGDFGCGEGRLQLDLEASGHKKGLIKSFDVGKSADHIIQADSANVPLEPHKLDVAVFCLSLMGTNFPDFLREANRVLKPRGKLFVAEVTSRFAGDGECKDFVRLTKEQAGFICLKAGKLKDFFYLMVFEKEKEAKKLPQPNEEYRATLKPCLYKRR